MDMRYTFASGALHAMNVLILEDEPLIAMSMQALVEDQGWSVVGPFATVASAIAAISAGGKIHCALLDCNLGGERSWPVADVLAQRDIPFAFTSGQTAKDIDPRFADRPSFTKPIDETRVERFLAGYAVASIGG
jgi:CheY-like chemotaxis protein